MLPKAIVEKLSEQFEIRSANTVSGGCINQCYCLETNKGKYFLKINDAKTFPGMFEAEAKGLELLAGAGAMRIPGIYEIGETGGLSFLLMEFIERGKTTEVSMKNFGANLAALHKQSSPLFGLNHDNYIGSLPQYNQERKTWAEFFGEMRLLPQVIMARNKAVFSSELSRDFELLIDKLPGLFPEEPPSLLHGDLWSGNYLEDERGEVCLMDPAVYYGHREMDIAMTRLFGSFDADFYVAYNSVFPLAKGWQQRINLCNLYPLLVHVNLFGAGYVGQLRDCLKQYL